MLRALLMICLVYGSLPSVSFSYVINFERYQKESECGIREATGGPVKASDESELEIGEWPWLVALLDADAKFFCSATLISSTKVITSAHCLLPKGAHKTRVLDDILMVFGSSNLNNSFDDVKRPFITKPSEIIIHEDWNASSTIYDADIALLISGDAVPLADSIKPVCMWSNGFGWKVDEVFTVGWSKRLTRDEHSVIPRQMFVDIIDSFVCAHNNLGVEHINSNQTICAIPKHQNNSCLDSAGAATYVKIDGVFYLHGLISQLGDGHRCNDQKPALITNMINFTSWINHRSGESFAESFDNFINSFPGLLKCFLICIQVHFWFMFCSKRY